MANNPDSTKHVLGSVAVVGGGVSGLAAAYRLKTEGVAVTVFEAEDASGGKIRSVSENGLIWEKGPNTMIETNPEINVLINELQLQEKQQFPVMQSKRYIVRDGKPQLLPSNPLAFMCSRLLSLQAKCSILFEPFLWKHNSVYNSSGMTNDESVGNFLERHFGQETVDYLVDPFVAGTSGSDPASLSIRHAFPDLWVLEKRYGSLVVGAIKSAFAKRKARQSASKVHDEGNPRKDKKRSRGSFSFFGGLQTLTNALVEKIGQDSLNLNALVVSLACNKQGNTLRNNWTVSYLKSSNKKRERLKQHFDAVVMTVPLHNFREMQISKDGKSYSTDFIPEVAYQPMSVLVTVFRKEDVRWPLQGFGILVPSKEQENGFQTLGTLFSSSMFPDRAPPDQVVFTTFVGGSRNKALASSPLEKIKEVAMADLFRLVGVESQPISVKHFFWSRAFPQYSLGYDAVLNAFEKLENELPGIYYAGNHRGGLAVGKALVSGYNAAGQVLDYLQFSGGRKVYTMALAGADS